MSDETGELAAIHERLAAIEGMLGVGATRGRRFRFGLQALFCLLAVVAALSFATVEHLKTNILEAENAKLEAAKASLESNLRAVIQQFGQGEGRSRQEKEQRDFEAKVERYLMRRDLLLQGGATTTDDPRP